MTFSIAARCAVTGEIGAAVSSSSISVGARCAWIRAGVGAAMTQNITDPALGPRLLDRLAAGEDARTALDSLTASEPRIEYRQLSLIDSGGRTAAWTGAKTLGIHGTAEGRDCDAAGNLLADAGVPAAMAAAFEASDPALGLPERLVRAMEAGLAAGGEAGPVHSAALTVCGEPAWPIVDLRADWAEGEAIAALRRLWDLYRPQMQDYITRAADPASAPAYGVPGDEG